MKTITDESTYLGSQGIERHSQQASHSNRLQTLLVIVDVGSRHRFDPRHICIVIRMPPTQTFNCYVELNITTIPILPKQWPASNRQVQAAMRCCKIGWFPIFLFVTRAEKEGDWNVGPVPTVFLDTGCHSKGGYGRSRTDFNGMSIVKLPVQLQTRRDEGEEYVRQLSWHDETSTKPRVRTNA